jgi:CheY-like chemotaxis protein
VVDHGEGMDEQTLSRASEPFYTTKGVGKGTGLGLSMVHGLAEQSGGRLVLESQLGRGTRVELWLPRADCVRAPRPDAPGDEMKPATRSLMILAVDDDGLVLMNTAALLEDLGHVVFVASSAGEALDMVEARPIDVVITDYAMPHMTGLQLAEAIKASRPDLPVALATGYAELPPGESHTLPRLAKPYSQTELARFLHGVATACEETAG